MDSITEVLPANTLSEKDNNLALLLLPLWPKTDNLNELRVPCKSTGLTAKGHKKDNERGKESYSLS